MGSQSRQVAQGAEPHFDDADLPVSPVVGLEPLLTIDQLCAWMGYSRKTIYTYRTRPTNPLPHLGPDSAPRFLPSEVQAWMRDEYVRGGS